MSNFEWVAAAVVMVGSIARLTRLVAFDSFPPSAWLRMKWDGWTKDGEWAVLVHCGYCFSMWAGIAVVGSGYLSDWHPIWWIVNGWLAASYAAAVFVAYDGDD